MEYYQNNSKTCMLSVGSIIINFQHFDETVLSAMRRLVALSLSKSAIYIVSASPNRATHKTKFVSAPASHMIATCCSLDSQFAVRT